MGASGAASNGVDNRVVVYPFGALCAPMDPISCSGMRRRAQLLGLVSGIAGLVWTAGARGDVVFRGAISLPPAPGPGTAIDLHVARENLDVTYADGQGGSALRLRRLGLALHERVSRASRLSLRFGWAGLTQDGRASTEGLGPSGYYAGLAFAAAWPPRSAVGTDLRVSWSYYAVRASDARGRRTDLAWQIVDVRPSLRLAPTKRLGLRLGPTAVAVDGDQRYAGTTTPVDTADHTGGFAAVDWGFPDGGVVTLRARGGNPRGLYAQFEARY
jgi:hypothetical protein